MQAVYLNHSGFALLGEQITIIVDYFKGLEQEGDTQALRKELFEREGAFYVLSTHFHPDHFNPEVLTWKEEREDIVYLFSRDILKRRKAKAEDAVFLRKEEVFKDEQIEVKTFGSTDVGGSFYIQTEGKHIFHAGDLNNWHWKDESTEKEVKHAEKAFLKELELIHLTTDQFDLAMFPVDPRLGTDFARGAEQFVEQFKVDTLLPMHFWDKANEIESFRPFAESHGVNYRILTQTGERIDF